MSNFFSDIVNQFKSAAQLPAQLVKSSQAKQQAQQTAQKAQPQNFFADVVATHSTPQIATPVQKPTITSVNPPSSFTASVPTTQPGFNANSTQSVAPQGSALKGLYKSAVETPWASVLEKAGPVQAIARMPTTGESFSQAFQNSPGFSNKSADIDRRTELSQKYQQKGLSREEAGQRAFNEVTLDKGLSPVYGMADAGFTPKIPEGASKTVSVFGKTDKPLLNTQRLNLGTEAKDTVTQLAEAIRPELEKVKGAPLTREEVEHAAQSASILQRATSREATLKREAEILKTRQHLAALAEGKGVSKDFVETLRVVSSEASNLGRQLQSLSIGADPSLNTVKEQIIKKLLDTGTTVDDIVKAAENVDFTNQKQVTAFYRQFVKPKLGEVLDEYRYVNLLSSPKTHIVNAFSNILQAGVLAPATKLYSGAVDAIGSGVTGKARQAYVSEVPAYMKGTLNSVGDAVSGALKALKGDIYLERPDVAQIPTGSKILKPFQAIPRLLEASDVFFRTLIQGGEREALALRAVKQGKELTPGLMKVIDAQAAKNAEYYVFRKALDPSNKTGQGTLLAGIDKLTNSVYSLRKVPGVKWFIPFVQTPMNILKQGIEYSPAGFATLPGAANKGEQIAKALLGSTVFAGAAFVTASGNSTWAAPTGKTEKALFYDSGRQPYSIKVGNKWVSYSKLGPLAYPIAMSAAWKYYHDQNPKAVNDNQYEKFAKSLRGISEFFADQSYLEGIGNLVDAIKGDEYAATQAISNLPSQLVPLSSLQRWIANIVDPIYRKSDSHLTPEAILQNLKKGIPQLSKSLPAIEDSRGNPSQRQFPVFNAFSPLSITQPNPSMENKFQKYEKKSRKDAIKDQREKDRKKH